MRRSANRFVLILWAVLLGLFWSLVTSPILAQVPAPQDGAPETQSSPHNEELSLAPAKVDVQPVARDEEIRKRLQDVLEATGWFTDPKVRVEEGVVFLNGRVDSGELKKWAGDLARNTQDVVAVANRLEIPDPSIWDFQAAWGGLFGLWRDSIRLLPFFILGLAILGLSFGASVVATRAARAFFRQRIETKLLRNVIARGVGALVFLCGVYILLRAFGLTQLALTVVGGTGLIGLALGLAFRDISENFLASIFLSVQRPFETGDLVEISGVTGYVQQLNMRTTILMALDGTLVQIPNASVYKGKLLNFTTNPNRQENFIVGIGYDDAIGDAQEIARQVLADHSAVLNDPEPWVLVDSMGKATINLRIYFWLNGCEHSWLKVRSSVIRMVKLAFQKQGISMPDEARGIIFPQGVPITIPEAKSGASSVAKPEKIPSTDAPRQDVEAVSTKAEAGLSSEANVLEEQARHAKILKAGANLLQDREETQEDGTK